MFLRLDGTFWIQLVNFAIFFALLNVLFFRPLSRAIVKRRQYINALVSDYDAYQAEANTLRQQAESTRAGARREAELRIAKARADASNAAAEMSAGYAGRVQQTVEQAHARASDELVRARANEGATIAELADMMVEKAVGGVSK